jgi:hypothetical protein
MTKREEKRQRSARLASLPEIERNRLIEEWLDLGRDIAAWLQLCGQTAANRARARKVREAVFAGKQLPKQMKKRAA